MEHSKSKLYDSCLYTRTRQHRISQLTPCIVYSGTLTSCPWLPTTGKDGDQPQPRSPRLPAMLST